MSEKRFYEAPAGDDARRSAPAALRNREPIVEVLGEWLPESGMVLELASGTGEHAAFFAERFPRLQWQPSDVHPDALASIEAWREESGLANFNAPIRLDASEADWPLGEADAVLSINMAHISPWEASVGLIRGAARILTAGSPLILYGPWLMKGIDTAPSNLAFDADLKRRDPSWGLRSVEEFASESQRHGLELQETREMPANNRMLLLRKSGAPR